MSEDILSVATPFPDVATLAQGYINRVDGERLLVPLEVACGEGEGVRFVIYLGDGTAAFAGAGRCVQVSDQGSNVPPDARYETLIDSLELDERSRPVYDYIVAVRAAAYGQTEAAEDGAAEVDAGEVEGAEVEAAEVEAAEVEAAEVYAGEATLDVDSEVEADSAPLEVDLEPAVTASEPAQPVGEQEAYEDNGFGYEPAVTASAEPEVDPFEEAPGELREAEGYAAEPLASERPAPESVPADSAVAEPAPLPPSVRPGAIPTAALDSFRPEAASFIPPPLPTGILQRPALALHWQPAPPRRPTPLPQTGLFRYSGPGLPKPAGAPRPDLHPSQLVQRAPRPS